MRAIVVAVIIIVVIVVVVIVVVFVIVVIVVVVILIVIFVVVVPVTARMHVAGLRAETLSRLPRQTPPRRILHASSASS